jgi:hypothetical protein
MYHIIYPNISNDCVIDIIPCLVTYITYEVGHLTDADLVFGVWGSVRSRVPLVHSGYRGIYLFNYQYERSFGLIVDGNNNSIIYLLSTKIYMIF